VEFGYQARTDLDGRPIAVRDAGDAHCSCTMCRGLGVAYGSAGSGVGSAANALNGNATASATAAANVRLRGAREKAIAAIRNR